MKDTLSPTLVKLEHLKHQVDSLTTVQSQTMLHLQKMQIQVDTLTKLSQKLNPELLETRISQASDTINNLGTHATSFGTMYSIIGIIVAVLSLALPLMSYINEKRVERNLEKKFNDKVDAYDTQLKNELIAQENAINIEIKKVNEAIEKTVFATEAQSLYAHAINAEKEDQTDYAAACYLYGAYQCDKSVQVGRANIMLKKGINLIKKLNGEDLNKLTVYLKSFGNQYSLEDYQKYFSESKDSYEYRNHLGALKDIIKKTEQ